MLDGINEKQTHCVEKNYNGQERYRVPYWGCQSHALWPLSEGRRLYSLCFLDESDVTKSKKIEISRKSAFLEKKKYMNKVTIEVCGYWVLGLNRGSAHCWFSVFVKYKKKNIYEWLRRQSGCLFKLRFFLKTSCGSTSFRTNGSLLSESACS